MMGESARGQVITFYSYKGGTGRSMALANVACLLAQEQAAAGGKPVLAIDWDLEAPGLHRYLEKYLPTRADAIDGAPGLMELFEAVRDSVRTGCAPDEEEVMSEEAVRALDLGRYVIPTAYPKLSFIKSGCFDDSYSTRANTFRWDTLFETAPSLFRLLAEHLCEKYSYVLIDSRTGITDTSGICTTLMPEKLVVVFTPNLQSLTGIVQLVKRAYAYRKASDDMRGLVVYPLPSRIETSLPDEMKRWRLGDEREGIAGWEQQFTNLLREVYELPEKFSLERYFDNVQVQHVPPYAFGEPIAVLREKGSERLSLTRSYDTFRGYLQRSAPWDDEIAELDETARAATRERLDRLNEAFNAATEAVREQVEVTPVRLHRSPGATFLRGLAVIIGSLILALVLLLIFKPDRASRSEVLTRVLNDADKQLRASDAVLLLAALLPDLEGSQKGVALRQLRDRVERMLRPVLRVPVRGSGLSISNDRLLFITGDGKIARFDLKTGIELPAPGALVYAAIGRPDDSIVTVTEGGTLRIYNDGKIMAVQALGAGRFFFGPDGTFLDQSLPDGTTTVWAIDEKSSTRPLYREVYKADALFPEKPRTGSFTRNGKRRVVFDRVSVRVISPTDSVTLAGIPDDTYRIEFDDSEKRVAAITNSGTTIVDVSTRETITRIAVEPSEVVFDPSGRTLAAVIPVNTLALYDAVSGVQSGVRQYQVLLSDIDFLPDGRLLVVLEDRIEISRPLADVDLVIESVGSIIGTVHDHRYVAASTPASVTAWSLEPSRVETLSDADLIAEACWRVGRDLSQDVWTTYFASEKQTPVCTAESLSGRSE